MSHKIVVGYDGSDSSRAALDFATEVTKAQGGSIVVAHVLEWSPYSFLTPNEIEERHMRRKEELSRAEEAILAPALAGLKDSGLDVSTALRFGQVAATLSRIAKETGADQIVIGRNGEPGFGSRVFGSVAISLAQAAPVPVTIVP
mgnify:FL=1